MHFTLVELEKAYEGSVLILLACTIPYAFLVSQSTSLDPKTVLAAAPFCLGLVAFVFVLHPPRGQHTLFAVSIELTILNAVLMVINFPDCRQFDTAVFVLIGSYIACNLFLGVLMSTRGLSSKDMGIMGRIFLAIGAAWKAVCVELRGGERHTSLPTKV